MTCFEDDRKGSKLLIKQCALNKRLILHKLGQTVFAVLCRGMQKN